ncbi:MAG: hypothetical protein FWC43_07260 [Planctomycetaceae bacterium]|nr:hypothetical protein [Planctomycetaceae bacterium]
MLVLLPCYSLESLSLERDSAEVNQLLSAWSALYHPALLEKEGKLSRWESATNPLKETKITLAVVPPCCDSSVPADWFKAKEEMGTVVVRNMENRPEIVEQLLEKFELTDHGFDDEFVDDLYAFGTAYLLTEVMTRQMRYMSMLDDSQVKTKIFEAVTAYRVGEHEKATQAIQGAFDLLGQSKEYFYPGSATLLDLTLTSPTTLGKDLRDEIQSMPFTNLFLPTEQLRELVEKEPQTLEILRSALQADVESPTDTVDAAARFSNDTTKGKEKPEPVVQLIGDDLDAAPLPMLPILEIADRLVQGILFYKEHLGTRPDFYGRMVRGLTPLLPQLLKLAGYKGAVHFTPRDGWQIPKETQSKIFWEGIDGTKIDSLLKFPLNAAEHDTFFLLPKKMGYSMNNDHTSTFALAHYPMKKSPWLLDLMRASRYSSVCGRLTKIREYFVNTRYTGVSKSFPFEKYWTNYLLQAVKAEQTGPVSDWVRYYRLQAAIFALQTLATLHATISKDKTLDEASRRELERRFAPMMEAIENRLFQNSSSDNYDDAAETQIAETAGSSGTALALAVYGKTVEKREENVGIFVPNPLSFPRTMVVDISELKELPKTSEKILLVREHEHDGKIRKEAVVEVPALGYLWIGPTAGEKAPEPVAPVPPVPKSLSEKLKRFFLSLQYKPKRDSDGEPPLVEKVEEKIERRGSKVHVRESYLLRNDYFEVRIDTQTGEMRSITTPNIRGTRFAHQLAFRLSAEERKNDTRGENSPNYGYTISCADSFEILSDGPVVGKLKIAGRLMRPDGTLAAKYVETFTIKRLCRVLELEFEIDPVLQPGDMPWDSYYAARFAWTDSLDTIRCGVQNGAYSMNLSQLTAPEFIDLRNELGESITILTGGLPYHRLFDDNRLDTIFIPQGERTRTFRLAIAVDVPQPVRSAQDYLLSDLQTAATGMIPVPKNPFAWLFSVSAKNVIVLRLEPLFEEENRLTGLRAILLETENRKTAFHFRAFLPIAQAYKTDLLRVPGEELPVTEGDRIRLEMHGREMLPIELQWKTTELQS